MANLITLIRFILLFVLLLLIYCANPKVQIAGCPLVIIMFILDGVDGYVARKRNETSIFGATFDIAVDRVVENVLWVVFVNLSIIPVWVALVFLIRGFLVDSIRSKGAQNGHRPFDMIRSTIGKFIVAGRFMRAFYAVLKAITFAYILLTLPWPSLFPAFYVKFQTVLIGLKWVLVYSTATICIARGLPVIVEFINSEDRPFSIFGK